MQEPPTQLEDVIVDGRPLSETVRDYVTGVSAPVGDRGLARWRTRVCVGVVNLRHEIGRRIIDRISEVATRLDLQAGTPGCEPNVLIAFAENARETASELVASRRRQFRIGVSGSDAGDQALRMFQESDRPVRWWHVSLPVDAETERTTRRLPGRPPLSSIGLGTRPSDFGAQVSSPHAASRVQSSLRDDLQQVVIVVDVDGVRSVSLESLADYLAMIALAQIDPDPPVTRGTILGLFDEASDTRQLTEWDLAYLESLYGAEQHHMTPGAISQNMQRRLLARTAAPVE